MVLNWKRVGLHKEEMFYYGDDETLEFIIQTHCECPSSEVVKDSLDVALSNLP